jgi:hypothetical protein
MCFLNYLYVIYFSYSPVLPENEETQVKKEMLVMNNFTFHEFLVFTVGFLHFGTLGSWEGTDFYNFIVRFHRHSIFYSYF